MAAVLLLLPLLAAPDLSTILRKADRGAAQRLVSIAGRAERQECAATAARLFERALELDSESAAARAALGYRREKGTWLPASSPAPRADAHSERASAWRAEARALEEWRATEWIRLLSKYATPEEARPLLQSLLEHAPRLGALHEALGHKRKAGSHVRPELEALAERLEPTLRSWRACATDTGENALPLDPIPLPGIDPAYPRYQLSGRSFAFRDTGSEARALAHSLLAPHRLMQAIFGVTEFEIWTPDPLVIASLADYTAILTELYPEEKERKNFVRYATFRHPEFFLIRAHSTRQAIDIYSHNVGYRTLRGAAAPGTKEDREYDSYAWIREGLGFLLSLELFDTAETHFSSTLESSGKGTFALPPADQRTRATLERWLRERMDEGEQTPLRELCGRSLNSLDFESSIEACAFLRFLLLLDPEAGRRLPAALAARQATEGAANARSEAAIHACYGRDFAELEPLFRIFVREIATPVE